MMNTASMRKGAFEHMPDLDLAARCAGGDPAAFEFLMRRHNQALFRAARAILKNDADAEDAVQDAYLLAYRRFGQFRGEASMATWLMRIAVNEAVARLRRSTRRANIIEFAPDGTGEDSMDDAGHGAAADAAGDQPESAAVRAQTRSMIEARIDRLPSNLRVVFVLRAVEELSVDECAVALGIPEATVRTRFFRARALLRPLLARDLDHALDQAFAFDGARCDRIVGAVLARL